ncbi:MAG: 50S ribosomal protein L29 [Bacteroidia bacterium]
MKQSQILELNQEELKDLIVEETQVLAKMVFNHTVSPIENPLKIRETRRTIARMKTELRKKEIQLIASNNA